MNFEFSDADKALWKQIDAVLQEQEKRNEVDLPGLDEALTAAGYPDQGASGPSAVAAQRRLSAWRPGVFLAIEAARAGDGSPASDLTQAAAALGIMHRVFEAATTHAKGTREDGRKRIGRQEFGFRLAEMLTLFQTAELLTYRAAWMEETSHGEASTVGACAKVFCTENAAEVASIALDVLGPDAPAYSAVEDAWRLAKRLQVTGTPCVQALSEIGDGVIRKEARS